MSSESPQNNRESSDSTSLQSSEARFVDSVAPFSDEVETRRFVAFLEILRQVNNSVAALEVSTKRDSTKRDSASWDALCDEIGAVDRLVATLQSKQTELQGAKETDRNLARDLVEAAEERVKAKTRALLHSFHPRLIPPTRAPVRPIEPTLSMKPTNLKSLIKHLATLDASDATMLSCFIDLSGSTAGAIQEIRNRADLIRNRLGGKRRQNFDDAFEAILDYLAHSLEPRSKGVAIYSRWGDDAAFLPLQFEVPLKTQLIADSKPHIYPIVELKDTYHRFVIVITTAEEVRILETTFGSVTENILKERPDLRERFGREWTTEHYQNHKKEREKQFVREKIDIIEKLMARRGHNHLIVTGTTKMVNHLTNALPQALREKVVTTFHANPQGGLDPIVLESMRRFVETEDKESHGNVERLEAAFLTNGLAVVGFEPALEALRDGYADMLVIDQNYGEAEMRECLVRLATEKSIPIETVKDSEALTRLGGVGCLLRYQPFQYDNSQWKTSAA